MIDTEEAESTERMSHRDTKTQRTSVSRCLRGCEYSRLFGAPSQRDIRRMRLAPVVGAADPHRTRATSTPRGTRPRHHQTCGDLTRRRVAVLSMLGPHVLSSDLLSHDRRVDLVSMRLYGADNGR